MAARKYTIKHQARVRRKIQTTQILKRLHGIALGEVEGDAVQVSAARILLDRSLPPLQAVGDDGFTSSPNVTVVFGSPPDD